MKTHSVSSAFVFLFFMKRNLLGKKSTMPHLPVGQYFTLMLQHLKVSCWLEGGRFESQHDGQISEREANITASETTMLCLLDFYQYIVQTVSVYRMKTNYLF